MNDEAQGTRPRRGWFVAAVAAAAVGLLAAVTYAVVWFGDVAGSCGVVRFYAQAFGVIVLGAWLAGTGVGLAVAIVGRRRNSSAVTTGSVIVILAGLLMSVVCLKTTHEIREADYTLKDTQHLLTLLGGNDLDARKLSAHALGQRAAPEAAPQLCAILDNPQEDLNLRFSAAIALSQIGGPAARAALERARSQDNPPLLADTAKRGLDTMARQESPD